MVGARSGNDLEFAALFEEPAFITLGAAYEKRPRFSGGAYHPIVKRLEQFLDLTLEKGLAIREERAAKLLELDDAVIEIVNRLKAKGLVSPYLKNFVVARINFLRFKREGTAEFDPTIAKMLQMARKFNVDNVNKEDVARMGGAPAEPESDEWRHRPGSGRRFREPGVGIADLPTRRSEHPLRQQPQRGVGIASPARSERDRYRLDDARDGRAGTAQARAQHPSGRRGGPDDRVCHDRDRSRGDERGRLRFHHQTAQAARADQERSEGSGKASADRRKPGPQGAPRGAWRSRRAEDGRPIPRGASHGRH